MGVISYLTVDGQIEGEEQDGSRTDYLTDPLGSVTATVNHSCEVVNQYWYKPYGGLLSRTGNSIDSEFQWCGTWGYRAKALNAAATSYVRKRHYYRTFGSWGTKDPLGLQGSQISFVKMMPIAAAPLISPFVYAGQNPATLIDSTGFAPDGQQLDLQACSSLQIPVSPILTLGIEYCAWCYDCMCPPHMTESASRCWSVTGHATFRIAAIPWDKIGGEVRSTAETLLRLLSGAAFGTGSCINPQKQCVPKGRRGDFSVCIRGCATMASISCCFGVSGDTSNGSEGGYNLSGGCSITLGYCGLPSLSLRVRVRTKQCD